MLWTPSASTKPSYCANNFVRHGLLQNHVLLVRWVLFQAVPFLFFIAIWRFILGRTYTRNVLIRSASRKAMLSDMHEFVRDIVAYGNSDI